ncbi:GNAT family N-acetyltransferase [Streptomyces sp. 8N706]|uniref:GNAT family N-acetyltransferase n=1 Tax=Streptomyces sp. 8N706 TaxID=3457416 RepID=UPI003FD424C9
MNADATTEPNVIIRTRTDEDLPAAAAGLVTVHAADGYPVEGVEDPQGWLSPPELLEAWVAEMAGQVVGHVAVSRPQGEEAVSLYLKQAQVSEGQVVVLARLFVLPQARRKAVGEGLAREAASYARRRKLALVGDVMTKDAAAIRLYERLGCQIIGSTIHTYGEGQQTSALCFVAPTD